MPLSIEPALYTRPVSELVAYGSAVRERIHKDNCMSKSPVSSVKVAFLSVLSGTLAGALTYAMLFLR